MTRHHSCRVSPFGHPRIHARLTAPRGISQPPTSFIGSQCQGIHHAPLNTYKHKTNSKKKLHINTPNNHQPESRQPFRVLDARNHYPQIKHHTPPPKQGDNTPSHPQAEKNGLVVSKPNSVSGSPHRRPISRSPPPANVCHCTRTGATTAHGPSTRIAPVTEPHTMWTALESRGAP